MIPLGEALAELLAELRAQMGGRCYEAGQPLPESLTGKARNLAACFLDALIMARTLVVG